MKIITFSLVSSFAALMLIGCDSDCCMDVQPEVANIRPTPIIQLDGQPVGSTLTCDPTENGVITLTAASTDSDGQVVDNIWKVDGTTITDSTISCPEPGGSKQICLVAKDDKNAEAQKCITLIATQSQPPLTTTTPPASVLLVGEGTGDGIYLDCTDVHDTDTIHTYPDDTYLYGSNTPKDIKEVTWKYTYFYADGTVQEGPNTKTQTEYNEAEGLTPGSCKKWFHQYDGAGAEIATIKIELTFVYTLQTTQGAFCLYFF